MRHFTHPQTGQQFHFGRQPRVWRVGTPHLTGQRRRFGFLAPVAPPPPVDYSTGMPDNLGSMLNNSLSCCTSAGIYHRRQVITFNVNPPMDTQPDPMVSKFYSLTTGYDSAATPVNGANPTDQGGIEQDVLAYTVKTGIPLSDGTVDKLLGFIEIDPKNANDVNWAINDCYGVYIGFDVPAYLEQIGMNPGAVWDVAPNLDNTIAGGHCEWMCAHDATGNRKGNSWGFWYSMTPAFWEARVDECYALIGQDLLNAKTDQTILGMTIEQVQQAMQPFAEAN